MNCIEHYFENLLTMGSDIKGEPNKNSLSKEVQEAIEICAYYIKHNQFQEQTTKNDIRYNQVKNELNRVKNELESTTKNDLGVDKTFYEQIVEYCNEHFLVLVEKDVWEDARKALTTKNDLVVDCISRKAVIDELKRYFHDEYYQRTSIQDCRDCFIEDVLNHLPSVTPSRK